jgi:arsenite-transporting ATPase
VASETFIEQQLGQLMQQVEELRALLCDSARTSVRLVLNPDHLSLQETQRAFTYFSLFGLAVDALYVNRILPNEVSDPFFVDWRVDQARHLDEIRESFAPLPVSEVPLRRREVVGVSALAELGRAVFGAADPIPPQADARAMAFRSDGRLQVLALRVSGLSPEGVDVQKSGADLHLRLGRFRRSVVLPQYLAGMNPVWARVEGSELLVAFEEPA